MAALSRTEKTGILSFAVCVDCGVDIDSWRERLLPIHAGTLAITERGALALHVEHDGVCDGCGGGRAEIRVETRPQLWS